MADTTIKKAIVEVEVKDNNNSAEKVAGDLEKIKKNAKDTSEGFGIMDTKFGKMWQSFSSGVTKGINSLKTFRGALIATGVGALVVVVASLVEWFKKTETGADLIEKGMKILGQTIKEGPMVAFNSLKILIQSIILPFKTLGSVYKNIIDVMTGKDSLKEAFSDVKRGIRESTDEIAETANKIGKAGKNINDAKKLAVEWDDLGDKRRENKVKDKQLDAEIQSAREKYMDVELKLKERVDAVHKAQSALNEQFKISHEDKKEEIRLIEEELRLYPDNQEWIEKLFQANSELEELVAQGARDRTKILREQRKLEKELEEEKKEEELKRLERLKEQRKLEKELEEKKNEEELERLKEQNGEIEKIKVDHLEVDYGIESVHKDKLIGMNLSLEEQKKIQRQQDIESAKGAKDVILGVTAELLDKSSLLFKKGSKAQKALSIATAIIDTYQAANAAYKAMAGIPVVGPALGIAASAAAIIAGLKNVSMIRKTEPEEKKAMGGWIGGRSHLEGGTMVEMESGEFAVNARAMAIPSIANSVIAANNIGNGNTLGAGSILSEERVAIIAAQVVKSIPVTVDENTSNKIGEMDRRVLKLESRFQK